jgi:adenine specific DNA methylase Mod
VTNRLYCGDNLGILREHIADESVDFVYLDPPFNSNATYNVLFKSPEGGESPAQIEAFDDTWHWGENAENAYWEVLHGPNTDAKYDRISRIQKLTIADILTFKKTPRLPVVDSSAFRKAKRETRNDQGKLDL